MYELLPGDFSVVVTVLSAEEVHDARLVVVHPLHVAFAPVIKVKVLHALHLSGINEGIYEWMDGWMDE